MNALTATLLILSVIGNAVLAWFLLVRRPTVQVPGPVRYVEVPGPEVVREMPGPIQYVDRPGPVEYVDRPGPIQYVDRPGPIEYVDRPGPERIVHVEVVKPVELPARSGPRFGAGPFPVAVPSAFPVGRDVAPDTVVDGVDLGHLHVRAGSQRGGRNRLDQRYRRDAFLTRIVPGFPRQVLLSAVAAGNPLGAWSYSAADVLVNSLATQVGAFAEPLAHAMWEAHSPDTVDELLRSTLRGTTGGLERLGQLRHATPGDASADLLAALSPLGQDPAGSRRQLVFGTGGGRALLLRDGVWHERLALGGGTTWTAERALPDGLDLRWQPVDTRPGDLLVLCTGATAELLTRPDVGAFLAETWRAGAPDLTAFLHDLGVQAHGADADRTVVCLWERG
ncbi:hypothetical protein GCM10009639_11810 [Kitasatospora putterlickiae]|uniref:PPM-type phosphatase domain-containing protein n=1 Tax=Kitasatospora putterlickiae TaxID=221725 RepID=A0ABN1XQE3_9ACTN